MIKYLTLLDSLGRVLPPDDTFADNVRDEIAYLGIEGPPSVYALVNKIVKKVGKNLIYDFDVLIWDDDTRMIMDEHTRFEDLKVREPGEEDCDWVLFWDDEWVNKKKSEDVESEDVESEDDD